MFRSFARACGYIAAIVGALVALMKFPDALDDLCAKDRKYAAHICSWFDYPRKSPVPTAQPPATQPNVSGEPNSEAATAPTNGEGPRPPPVPQPSSPTSGPTVPSPPPTAAPAKPNAVQYSFGYWPAGVLSDGQVARVRTPFGTLRCVGGNNVGGQRPGNRGRSCYWE